ncbi:hypothetical protein [Nocardia cyriacigeorgica]|uniref:Uncharacterized protein n=1 Tax=Nocardia cyriacigeorgica TaxID=135487 RepID=A0A5R8NB49_9NOCA|nr:hypothetical protein [Nocardia cyriacigeorgica]TLF72942.1 hypothetical protein FEK34_28390 [Nocardia cyriacigeorgica]
MAELGNQISQWRKLADEARAGELYIADEGVARACLKACNDHIDDLEDMLTSVNQVQAVSGFGNFNMARDLEAKFREQAVGTENSLFEVIQEHIDVVTQMRDVMVASIEKLTGRDVDNAGNYVGVAP